MEGQGIKALQDLLVPGELWDQMADKEVLDNKDLMVDQVQLVLMEGLVLLVQGAALDQQVLVALMEDQDQMEDLVRMVDQE